jgi:putative restriction endonuclease
MAGKYGEILDQPEGTVYGSRASLSEAGMHRPLMAGICGPASLGAESIVLSGGYEDDQDYGDDSATGSQIGDQTLTRQNMALAVSRSNGSPVRVIRGSGHVSPYSPNTGFRYDGLFSVEDCWQETGRSGHVIWRFRLAKHSNAHGPTSLGNSHTRRMTSTVSRIIRDTEQARTIKKWYDYRCQICGVRIEGAAGPYAESAHIKPLGSPHCGPDTPDNILCLCPNHHVMFDYGGVFVNDDLSIVGTRQRLTVVPNHFISIDYLRYHRHHYMNR